ncbi:MAG: hypothetical protein M1816_007313 [Peltula sp. TS41687]|nr:MAG: hypothetical protein M1816_007313 [Peltula sp. TS41687]
MGGAAAAAATATAAVNNSSDDTHQGLLDALDVSHARRPFRNPQWKPATRRNKNVKQILIEASRKEASLIAPPTQNNSGISTPLPLPPPPSSGGAGGVSTPSTAANGVPSNNITQAAQNLSTLVLERNLQQSSGGTMASVTAATATATTTTGAGPPAVTYTNIESAPSLLPSHQKHYCDITGLPAPYTDPKTRLRYHNKEVFGVIRTLGRGVPEKYLEARGAQVILK